MLWPPFAISPIQNSPGFLVWSSCCNFFFKSHCLPYVVTLSSANTYSHDKIDVPFSDYVATTVDVPPAVNDSGADLWV